MRQELPAQAIGGPAGDADRFPAVGRTMCTSTSPSDEENSAGSAPSIDLGMRVCRTRRASRAKPNARPERRVSSKPKRPPAEPSPLWIPVDRQTEEGEQVGPVERQHRGDAYADGTEREIRRPLADVAMIPFEQYIEPPQRDAVDVKEVSREGGCRPGGVRVVWTR
jgi:hypothetical protein